MALIIDDTNFQQLVTPDRFNGTRPRGEHPLFADYGSAPFLDTALPKRIDRSEWSPRIKEMEAKQERISDAITWDQKNQDGTNFCWANGPCGAAETSRVLMGLPYAELSAAAVACRVNGYVNRGGWGIDAIEYMAKTGVCEVKFWPNAAIDKRYDTADSQSDRAEHLTIGWVDVGKNFDDLMTLLLLKIPVTVGYSWWSHEVLACDPVEISSNHFGVRIRNSWKNAEWGDVNVHGQNGFGVLSESKGTPDDAQAVWQQTASEN